MYMWEGGCRPLAQGELWLSGSLCARACLRAWLRVVSDGAVDAASVVWQGVSAAVPVHTHARAAHTLARIHTCTGISSCRPRTRLLAFIFSEVRCRRRTPGQPGTHIRPPPLGVRATALNSAAGALTSAAKTRGGPWISSMELRCSGS